jgi:hypothetical protein
MGVWEPGDEWYPLEVQVMPGKGTSGRKKPEPETRQAELLAISGIDKVPGSLNLWSRDRVWLRRDAGTAWSRGLIYPGRIGGIEVAACRKATHHGRLMRRWMQRQRTRPPGQRS